MDDRQEPLYYVDFDQMIEDSLTGMPPNEIVKKVTPWRKAIKRVLAGQMLNTVILYFWNLEYILPLVGFILSILGLRTLRKESRWFFAHWIITMLRTAWFIVTLIMNATIYNNSFYASTALRIAWHVGIVLQCLSLCLIWKAFRAVREKAGLASHVRGMAALAVWYVVCYGLALWGESGNLVGIIMLIAFLCIIYRLFRLPEELDEAGYVIQAAPVHASDRTVVAAVLMFLGVAVACGYLFFGSYPMDWQQASDTSEDAAVADIKWQLAGLGFPQDILNDLAAEDIYGCKDATKVVMHVKHGQGLCLTSIGVKLSGTQGQWKIFHHFLWEADPGFYGTELIQVYTADRYEERGYAAAGKATGRLLYNDGTDVYTAPCYSLERRTYTPENVFFFDGSDDTDIFALFSMPDKGTAHRGYVAYAVTPVQEEELFAVSVVNYTHQKSWMQYPVRTAFENYMETGWNEDTVFWTLQDSLCCDSARDGGWN